MKNKILEALKLKYEGVDAKILTRTAEKIARTVTEEEQVQPAVDGVTFASILEAYGDSRATEASASAVSNYEKKHGLKDGRAIQQPSPNPEPTPGGQTDADAIPAWAQQMIELNKAMQSELAAIKTGKTISTRQQQLSQVLEALPEGLRKPYARTPIADLSEEEFTAQLGEIKTEVEGIAAQLSAKGAVFGAPVSRANGQPTNTKEATPQEAEEVAKLLNLN